MAQAGGRDPSKLDEALAAAREAIERGARLSRMRVLALDHGTARCGCAISDPTGTLATPLIAVIEPPEPATVAALVAEHDAERVVVGLPAP